MDFSDINKVATRKRVNTDADMLREKMSRESANIIKLRVAQDTAYWDLKERLSGVEAEHERLQQNMLDVQMQHETLSAQYQDELRLRPETLNKLASTREICDVLEEQAGRLRASLGRAAADRAALAESYAGAARRVHHAHSQHARNLEHANLQGNVLADKLRLSTEHNAQLAQLAADAQRQAEARETEARAQLSAAAERHDQLRDKYELIQEKAALTDAALIDRERFIAQLKQELERRAAESKAETETAETLRAKLQKELETLSASLAASEARGDGVTKECSRLLDSLVTAEEKVARLSQETVKLKSIVQNLEAIGAELKRGLEVSGAKNETLQKEIDKTERENRDYVVRLEEIQRQLAETRAAQDEAAANLRSTVDELESERQARAAECAAAKNELQALESFNASAAAASERALTERAETVARLMRDVAAEGEARARTDAQLQAARVQLDLTAQARDELSNKLQGKEKELAAQKKIILEITSEKERLQDIIRGMQGTIDNIQKELTREPPPAAAHAAEAARRQPPEHDDNARDAAPTPKQVTEEADPPAAAHAAAAAARRQPPEHDDNARDAAPTPKQVTEEADPPAAAHAAAAAARRQPPEHDDNARDAAPTPKQVTEEADPPAATHAAAAAARRLNTTTMRDAAPTPTSQKQGVCSKPPKSDRATFLSPNEDSLFYHFLSDSSDDGDMIDQAKVNARFEAMALGIALPPTSLHALKRRRPEARAPADDELSMSQVKADLANRGRTFFRNKRLDAKPKKAK